MTLKQGWSRRPVGANDLGKWVVDRGSLTERIAGRCENFSVRHVVSRFVAADRDEFRRIGLERRESAFVREVFLCCGETPVVFAHSVAARKSLKGAWRSLKFLGKKSLGSAFLSNPKVGREALEFRRINRRHPLYEKSCRFLDCRPAELWARRSLFSRGRNAILVTEVFLPQILELP